jgi:hypothetical protein
MEEIKSGELLRIWWLFAWRFAVGSFLLSFSVGFVIGLVGTLTHTLTLDQLKFDAQIAGGVISLFWSLGVILMALTKTYRGFRIAIVRGELPLCRSE